MKATNVWQYLANAQLTTTAWQPNKKNNLQNTFLCKKTNAGRQSTRQMQELKFWLQYVEILIALPYLRRVFYLYIEHAHKNRKRAKMLFCAKTIKRRQTKYKANARVEILIAIRWNFDCITLLRIAFRGYA